VTLSDTQPSPAKNFDLKLLHYISEKNFEELSKIDDDGLVQTCPDLKDWFLDLLQQPIKNVDLKTRHTSSDYFLINGKYNISDYFCKYFQMMPGFT